MRLIVCESCEAEFKIKHSLNEGYYRISFCPFCGDDLDDEFTNLGDILNLYGRS